MAKAHLNASRWTPLLDGELGQAARTSVEEIVQDLLRLPSEKLYCRYLQRNQPSLGALEPWVSLLLAYYCESLPKRQQEQLDRTVLTILNDAQGHLTSSQRIDLYGGWCGVGWAISHLTDPDGDDELDHLDAVVEKFLSNPSIIYKLDLIGGLVGYGVYLLERLPSPVATRGLHHLVDQLNRRAESTSDGCITWWTPPELMSADDRIDGGVYNLGMAHGIPGIIGILAAIHRAGVAQSTTAALLERAIPWLLKQRLPVSSGPCFPHRISPTEVPKPARIAWCYGELGASVALAAASRELDRADWEEEALDLARNASRVKDEAAGVVDPGLCHGAAGNAHIFNRLFQATGEKLFRDAAVFWFEKTLSYRRPDRGIGGYQSNFPGRKEQPWGDDASFIMGSTGIGLTLLAAVSAQEPAWDRLLLLS